MTEESPRLAEVDARSKSNTHRIDQLQAQIGDLSQLVTTVAVLAQKQDTTQHDVEEIKTNVQTILAKPGRRWDAVAEKIIVVCAGALAAYLLAKAGL